jgi:hypothetical protein
LGRPGSERPFLLLVRVYPPAVAWVPYFRRTPLDEFASFFDL